MVEIDAFRQRWGLERFYCEKIRSRVRNNIKAKIQPMAEAVDSQNADERLESVCDCNLRSSYSITRDFSFKRFFRE